MYKRILLAYDGSESGQKALLDCQDIAHMGNAELFLIAVRPPPSALIGGEGGLYDPRFEEQEEQQYRAILEDGLKRLAAAQRPVKGEVLVGDAVDEITNYAGKVAA